MRAGRTHGGGPLDEEEDAGDVTGRTSQASSMFPAVDGAADESGVGASGGDATSLSLALDAKRIFTFGGYGKKPTGGAQLWHSVVDIRKAYSKQPIVDKLEIEAYQGCNYYTNDLHSLSVTSSGRLVWRPQVPTSDAPNVDPVMPSPRIHHTATLIPGNRILLFGGHNAQLAKKPYTNDAFVYDISAGQWDVVLAEGRAPPPRSGHTASLVGRTLVVVGGQAGPAKFYRSAFSLDLDVMDWQAMQPAGDGPPPLAFHSADVVNGVV